MRRNYNWPHQIAVVADPDFLVEIIFAAASGLRAGEHHALRWRHIGFNRREVDVETRVDAYNEEDVPSLPLACVACRSAMWSCSI
jgi:integrase